ncbi:MAG TPA: SWIM zinc finger family protein [Pyrinomonadaceae bacterium]|nr:SWIM zinc finger family protein [Pyrinomonadaceae bacterium]
MSIREQKARQIIERANITRNGNLWLVPSQSGRGRYKVDAEKRSCSCPDYDFRRQPCKHIFAVELIVKRGTIEDVKYGKTWKHVD